MNLATIAKQSSLYLLGNIASRAVGFFMIPVYARNLTPAEYGMVELLELCIQVVVIALGIQALGGSMIRIFYDYEEGQPRRDLVSATLYITVFIGLAIVALAFVSADPVSTTLFKSSDNAWLIRLAFVAMAFGSIAEVALLYYRLRDRVGLVVLYSLVQLTAGLALNIYFIVFRHMGVWGFIWSKLITSVIGGVVLGIIVFRVVGFRWRLEPTRRLVTFALPLVLTGLSVFAIHFSDRFFINQLRTLRDVGIYSMAYKFAFLISFLVGEPFGRVWNVSLYAHTGTTMWRGQAAKAARYLTMLLFLVGLGLCLFIPPLLSVFTGPSYGGVAALIPILVLAYIAREMGDFFKAMLYVNKRTYAVSNITLLCACVNITLNLILIRTWGISGAAWATLITWTLYMACCWTLAEREHRIAFGPSSFARVCGLAVVIFGMTQFHPWGEGLWLVAQNAFLIVIFCTLLVAAGYVPRGNWATVLTSVAGIRSKTS